MQRWVYIATPIPPSLEKVMPVAFPTPAAACEAFQSALVGAILAGLERESGKDQIHAMVEEIAGQLHQLWESGELHMVSIVEEMIST